MKTSTSKYEKGKIPTGLRFAAIYLIVSGVVGLAVQILGFGPHHAEFTAKSIAFKAGTYSRESIFNILFLISGIGIFYRKLLARYMALILLVISTIYAANSFAWGFEKGDPSANVLIISYVVMGLWNGLWFYLICRDKSKRYFMESV